MVTFHCSYLCAFDRDTIVSIHLDNTNLCIVGLDKVPNVRSIFLRSTRLWRFVYVNHHLTQGRSTTCGYDQSCEMLCIFVPQTLTY